MANDIHMKVIVNVDDKELKEINKNLTDTGKQLEDVGDKATKELKDVNNNLTDTGKKVENIGDKAKKSKSGLSGMAAGFKGIGVAIKSAGIGIALSVIAALYNLLKQNQDVLDFMNKGMKTLAIMFNDVTSAIEPFIKKMQAAFDNPLESLKELGSLITDKLSVGIKNFFGLFINGFAVLDNLVKGAGFALAGIFDDDAAAEADKYFEKAGESAKDFAKNAYEVVDTVALGMVSGLVEVGKAAVDSFDKAATAANKFIQKENELKLAEAQLNKMVAENSLEIQNQKLIRDDENQTIEARIAAAEKIQAMIEAESAASIKLQQDKIALMKADLKLTNTTTQDKVDIANAEAQLSIIQAQAATRSRENLLKTNSLGKKLNAEKIEDDKVVLTEEEKLAAAELKRIEDLLAKKKELQAQWRLEDAESEQAYYDEKLKQEQSRFEEDLILAGENQELITIAEEENRRNKEDLEKEHNDKLIEDAKRVQDEKLALTQKGLAQAGAALDVYSSYLDAKMNSELKSAEGNEKKQEAIRKEYGEKKKKAAYVGVIIDTAQAVIGTWAGYSSMGVPGTILAAIQTAAIVAAGAVQLSTINSQSFGQGGVLDGPKHANGGILTPYGELEGGEGIINAASMNNPSLRNLASTANTAGGGKDFSSGDGSINLSSASIAAIISGINDKKVYVSETDITTTQNKVKVVENESYL